MKIQESTEKNLNAESKKEQLLNRDQRLPQSEGMHAVAES